MWYLTGLIVTFFLLKFYFKLPTFHSVFLSAVWIFPVAIYIIKTIIDFFLARVDKD